ncbi:hypothetical protein [Marinoscillum sp.]|uniref:hypothetical protein n=1 Tax=Marinoscillum sp. TaxID=2024838 RepID=UPI003BA9393A
MANNLDRLFREGLDQYEVTPNAQSWKQVQGQIAINKKRGMWLWSAAAAVALLLVGTMVLRNINWTTPSDGQLISGIDHPAQAALPAKIFVPAEEQEVAPMTVQMNKVDKPASKPQQVMEELPKYELIQIASIQTVQINGLPAPKFGQELKEFEIEKPTVKITYIADNQPTDKKNKLNEFITSISKEASPIEILADIRDAKDNIFSRN